MKILAISDFDNGFPKSLSKKLKREKPNIILSAGDFCYGYKIRKIMFKNYDSKLEWYDIMGRRKATKLMLESVEKGDKVMKFLNNFDVPIFMVFGNHDKIGAKIRKNKWIMYRKDLFTPILNKYKNIIPIDLKTTKFEDYTIVGYGQQCSGPELSKYRVKKNKQNKKDSIKEIKKFKQNIKILNNLFKNINPKKTIFLIHNVPFNTKLDKITSKSAPESVQGKHFGSVVARKIIEKRKPFLCIGGHIHEGYGKTKIGKTLCINNGPASENHYAIIDIINNKVNVRLK